MSKRSFGRRQQVLTSLVLGALLAGCQSTNPGVAYTTPGWYLERPRPIVTRGPEIFAGPFTYDQCEAERLKYDTAWRMLCINEKTQPPITGPF